MVKWVIKVVVTFGKIKNCTSIRKEFIADLGAPNIKCKNWRIVCGVYVLDLELKELSSLKFNFSRLGEYLLIDIFLF